MFVYLNLGIVLKYKLHKTVDECDTFGNRRYHLIQSDINLWYPISMADCCLISTSADFDTMPLIMTACDTHAYIVIN